MLANNLIKCGAKSGFATHIRTLALSVSRLSRMSSASTAAVGEPSTLSEQEVAKFRAMASNWWDRDGECKPLHSMNRLRVALVREGLVSTGAVSADPSGRALAGIRVLDVGCGAGILSEALARLGASVTGLDACQESVAVAVEHSRADEEIASNVRYECGTIEAFAAANEADEKFDAVVASEVVEHVENQELFVQTCCSLLKESGSIFFTTLNRTTASWLGGVVAAEYVLRLLPVGTHDWRKFISPEDLGNMLHAGGCQTRLVRGMLYCSVTNYWHWIPLTSVNYALHAIKIN